MPEALAVLLIFVVSVAVYAFAWLQARNPATQEDVSSELARLQRHEAWLRERLILASQENWGDDMTGPIEDDLRETVARIARLRR